MTDVTLSSPDSKSGRLQRICLEMIRAREDEPDGLPTSARFIYYELVQRGIVAKHKVAGEAGRRSDQDVIDAVYRLRLAGEIPWNWIVDETRSIDIWRYARTVADYLEDTIINARIDVWAGGAPPMILTESRSLAGVLRRLTSEYLAPIAPTNGQVGGFLYTDVAPALRPGQRVLYLGDHDWQGGQIENNTRRVLERLVGELRWERLAITAKQVADNNLPIIQKADRRYKPAKYHDAVETEAFGQSAIVSIVRSRLDSLLPEPLADVLEREQAQREKVRAALITINQANPRR